MLKYFVKYRAVFDNSKTNNAITSNRINFIEDQIFITLENINEVSNEDLIKELNKLIRKNIKETSSDYQNLTIDEIILLDISRL